MMLILLGKMMFFLCSNSAENVMEYYYCSTGRNLSDTSFVHYGYRK